MTDPTASHLLRTLDQVATRSASAVVARSRASSLGLNAALLRRLSAPAGTPGSLLAEPTFETARSWTPASETFGSLAGNLLSPDLVEALDRAGEYAMPQERRPYWHQVEAWRTTLGENASCLVTAGTGAGKTECFLIPILDDLLKNVRRGGGVQAILLYPLNALIDSQRDRLKAWAEGLGGRVRFALFNGNTPETPRRTGERPGGCELKSRREIRERPPEILVTNITMLEYMLLRPTDEAILERSQGALRWIVLDEAHVYAGAQAAEMALLLRRVRAAFGVSSENVRLIATSATIGGESDVKGKLAEFISTLAGRPVNAVRVIEGRVAEPELPAPGLDEPIKLDALHELDAQELWRRFAPHPRLQKLRLALAKGPQLLGDIAETLFCDRSLQADTQAVLDAAARADAGSGPLLPWRAHLFHKPLGGVCACIDTSCPERDPELQAEGANWKFGALNLGQRDRCSCGSPAFEVYICAECGNAHLVAGQQGGSQPRLEPLAGDGGDDFGLDVEPEAEEEVTEAAGRVWLFPANGGGLDCWVALSGQPVIFDNAPPDDVRAAPLRIVDRAEDRCCGASGPKDAMPLRYGPAFFMGNSLPLVVETLAPPVGGADMPSRGRRALTFSDSRQGVARLAAKLQQDAERALTRAFLYHTVQGREDGDLAKVAQLEDRLSRLRKSPDDFGDIIRETEAELARISGDTLKTVPWHDLVNQFAQHAELSQFAGKAWAGRIRGAEMAEDPKRLAQMLLFRELFRRPKVQNNPETMGLLRLAFPNLEAKARLQGPPRPLQEAGVDGEGWRELALLAIDLVFRDYLAVDLPDPALPSLISPRFGVLRGVGAIGTEQSSLVRPFPGARPGPRPSNLHRAVYSLIGGHWDSDIDRTRAATVLDALWTLIATTAARDVGRGVWRIDFSGKAHIERIDKAFYCPVTRRLQGYAVLGRSPRQLDPDQPLADIPPMERVAMPRLPIANRGGLDEADSKTIQAWCESNPAVVALRRRGLWTDLHDRVASFAPFLRAQEHSAQIDRAVLARYVEQFTAGEINFLNCSTTMEMGVDIPQVRLVANSNVPPSIANYRQRAGRAGRRGEPWAFTLTFARDLPLDRFAADDGARYLRQDVAAPRVWLESASLVQRHVNAFLLAGFLRSRGGLPLKSSTGAFFGAGTEEAVLPDAPADAFLSELSSPVVDRALATSVSAIVAGSALEQSPVAALATATAQAFKTLLERWRAEYGQLLERAAVMTDQDARLAVTFRARRMHGEFLLGELARRNFTPAYGFPTDVVSFDFLSGRRSESHEGGEAFGLFQGAASRTLDVAIREYAPGAELVIDGLVYRSEGILPAWGGDADNSRLEDLRELWSCSACGCFGLARERPSMCHACGGEALTGKQTLAPAGFISRAAPHTGYESLAQAPFEMPRISAARGAWCALPEAAGGRFRADPAGEVIVTGGGVHGEGYAVCLACGRAEAEPPRDGGTLPSLARSMKSHRPLMLGRGTVRAADGNCPGGHTQPNRVQRGVTLVHAARTDVFELQLASGVSQEAGLALAAGLRDGLAERLGVEAREIGVAVGSSIGLSGEARLSVHIFDRAAGGAGYALRLADPETIALVSERALDRLACPEDCKVGCAACVLRPDLNIRDLRLDRRGGHDAAAHLVASLNLPAELRTFGPDSRPLGRAALDWLKLRLAQGRLTAIVVFLPAELPGWDIDGWAVPNLLRDMADRGIVATLAIPAPLVASTELTLVDRLAILRAASGGQLVTVAAPPHMGGRAIAAIVGERTSAVAIACDAAEALPGPDWCANASAPVVIGPAPNAPTLSSLSVEALLGPRSNAAIVWPGRRLDGDLQNFGQRFWTLLQSEAPALVDVINSSGVRLLSYSDRYLVTPLSIALAAQVIRQVPNAGTVKILLSLAPADPPRREPDAIHDSFERDADRRGLLEALIPGASISFARRKSELHHHRELRLMLGNGKTVSILLDQGFGSWRSDYTRHSFQVSASAQARSMTALRLQVRAESDQGSPIAVSLLGIETNELAR